MIRRNLSIGLLSCLLVLFAGPVCAQRNHYVRWVDDGDTVVLGDGRRVRYIGINAPEVARKEKKGEPFGEAARDFNRRLVFKQNVRLELDEEKYDPYKRLLAYVFLKNEDFVNQLIVARGLAYVLYRKPNIKYHKLLLQTQRRAMDQHEGMWRNWKETEGRYPGSKRSKRFHLPDCPNGKKIYKRNRVYFSRQWDAFRAGYAPGKRCFSAP